MFKYHDLELFLKSNNIDNIYFFISGYKTDHPSGNRKGGPSIFIKTCILHDELPPIQEEEFQIS